MAVADPASTLTHTERRLWETLRAQPGRVFSRKELLEHVVPGTIVLPRTIDVHIRGLRKKLGNDVARIRTVRSEGYCYENE